MGYQQWNYAQLQQGLSAIAFALLRAAAAIPHPFSRKSFFSFYFYGSW